MPKVQVVMAGLQWRGSPNCVGSMASVSHSEMQTRGRPAENLHGLLRNFICQHGISISKRGEYCHYMNLLP